jgi:RNA polymerase sigma factor (sigma-70 family)
VGSPKIRRPSKRRRPELDHYLERCDIPPTPPEEHRDACARAAKRARLRLAQALQRAKALRRGAEWPPTLETLQAGVQALERDRGLTRVVAAALAAARAAVSELGACHLRLAVQYALGTDARGLHQDDLVQECMVAVMRTAGEFDPDNAAGCGFASRAAWWLRHYADRAVGRGDAVREPPAVLAIRRQVVQACERSEQAVGRLPDAEELRAALADAGKKVSAATAERAISWVRGEFRTLPAFGPDGATLTSGSEDRDESGGRRRGGDYGLRVEPEPLEAEADDAQLEADRRRDLLRARLREEVARLPTAERRALEPRLAAKGTRRRAGVKASERAAERGIEAIRAVGLDELAADLGPPCTPPSPEARRALSVFVRRRAGLTPPTSAATAPRAP